MRNEEGQDLLEYALLVALIAIVAVAAVTAAGDKVKAVFNADRHGYPVVGCSIEARAGGAVSACPHRMEGSP